MDFSSRGHGNGRVGDPTALQRLSHWFRAGFCNAKGVTGAEERSQGGSYDPREVRDETGVAQELWEQLFDEHGYELRRNVGGRANGKDDLLGAGGNVGWDNHVDL